MAQNVTEERQNWSVWPEVNSYNLLYFLSICLGEIMCINLINNQHSHNFCIRNLLNTLKTEIKNLMNEKKMIPIL